ncbi:MAG: hypothetical protein CMI52_04415 [Parcubacteria group bacterium]|nr:hypothetical protein [Parcubacteria group bacterium]
MRKNREREYKIDKWSFIALVALWIIALGTLAFVDIRYQSLCAENKQETTKDSVYYNEHCEPDVHAPLHRH